MLQAMREAQRPVPPRAISSGSPYEAEPARTAAPAAQPVSMPGSGERACSGKSGGKDSG